MESAWLLASHLGRFGLVMALLYLPGLVLSRLIPALARLALPVSLVRISLGSALWMMFLFSLGALRLLSPAAVWAGAASVTVLAVPALVGAARRVWRAGRPVPVTWPPAECLALLLALAGVGVFLFLQALSPEVATDAQVYHLHVPKLILRSHGFRHIPFNIYSHWPMNVELLFTLALALGDHVLANLVHFFFGILTLVALVLFGREWHRTWAGLLAAAFYLANGVVLFEMSIAYVDVACAFFLLMAFWCVARALASPDVRRAHLVAAGVLAGVLAGSKLSAAIGVVALGLVYLVVRARQHALVAGARELTVCMAIPCAAVAAPWFVKSALETGNPVYPLLYSWLGGIEWSSTLAEQFAAWHRGIGMGREPLDYLLLPFRVALLGGPGYDRFGGTLNPAWVLLVPVAFAAARRQAIVAWGLGAGIVYFVLWSLSSQQSRFLIPALPLMAIAAGIALVEFPQSLRSARARRLAEAGLYLGAAALLVLTAGLTARAQRWRGAELRSELRSRAVPAVFRYVNERLPPDARLLFVDVNRGYFCDRELVADSFFEASQINELLLDDRSSEEILAALRSLGITHVLRWGHTRGIPYPRSFRRLFRAETGALRLLFEDESYLLYEVTPPAPSASP